MSRESGMKAIEFCMYSEACAGVFSRFERKPPKIREHEEEVVLAPQQE